MRAFYALSRSWRMRIASFMACAWLALCLVPNLAALTITTFRFSDLDPVPDRRSQPVVGPEGDIWFTVNNPARLMRIRDSRIECVLDSGITPGDALDLSVSPDGRLYLSNCRYVYLPEEGIVPSGVRQPQRGGYIQDPGIFDADLRMYCTINSQYMFWREGYLFEMSMGEEAILRFQTSVIGRPLIVSLNECWMTYAPYLSKINLETGEVEERYRIDPIAYRVCAKDSMGRLWLSGENIVIFDGENSETFAATFDSPDHEWYQWYDYVALTGDMTTWAITGRNADTIGITRFKRDDALLLTAEDGLLSGHVFYPPSIDIDYDGNVWVLHNEGISRIADGGWPPMRLMLHRLETPESIAVEAQVINNGPVVGVDVYVALELNGQLLFWPNWQPEPSPVQVNLCPGFSESATIIEMPRSQIPPGSYTFWGCMTGRGTQKLIGPLDRKFEVLRIDVNEGN